MEHRGHRHRLGFVFTALLVAAGVAVFVGLRATVHDLDHSLDHFYEQTHFADLTVVGGDTDALARRSRPGGGRAGGQHSRHHHALGLHPQREDEGAGHRHRRSGHRPDDQRPVDHRREDFDRTAATAQAVAVVEQHTADDLEIAPGATIVALGLVGQSALDVVGIGLSPEYLLPAQSQQQVVTTPGSFAVVFVPESVVEQLGGGAAVPQVLVKYEGGVDRDALDARLTQLANAHGAQLVEPRADQPSNGVIQEELTGFREASIVIPALALVVAALVGALACARVDDERRRRRMLAITVSTAGVVGVVLGLVGAAIGGPDLADSVYLPEHVGTNNWVAALVGLGFSRRAGARDRCAAPGRQRRVAGRGPAAVTAIAAAAAVICVVAPGGVVDSAEATLDAAARLEQVSAQVAFATPVNPTQLGQLTAVDGIAAAEAVPSANVFVRHDDRRYATSLEAFPAGTSMQHFEAPDGRALELPATGALIPESLGAMLDARPGDELEITLPGAGVAPFTVPVAAFTSNTLGNLVFLRTSGLRTAMGADADAFAGGLFDTAAVRFTADADPARVAEEVQGLSSVVVYVPVAANLNTVDQARPIFAAVIQALLAIGAVVTILGLTSAVVLHTHTRRRVGGRRVTLEVFGAVVAGIVVGALLGTLAADRLVDALDTTLIHLSRQVDPSTYLLAAGMVLLVSTLTLGVSWWTRRRTPDATPVATPP